MMCIAIRGGCGNDVWRGLRCGEIIGHHYKENRVFVLSVLYMKNMARDGTENYLHLLHPGNVSVELRGWPIRHPDETDNARSIFESVYGEGFEEQNEQLFQTKGLSSWDSWFHHDNERITIWPNEELTPQRRCKYIKKILPKDDRENFVPFSVFQLGPFTKAGAILINLLLTLVGETYEKLVTHEPVFTIDGPERLLRRVEDYIDEDPRQWQQWRDMVDGFHDYLDFGESYDVALINNSNVDKVKVLRRSGIVEAPIQPKPQCLANRYISSNSAFKLTVGYSSEKIKEEITKMVLARRRREVQEMESKLNAKERAFET